MEQFDQIASVIALTLGVAWGSGINLYAVVLVLGLLGSTGNMVLPQDLQLLMNPLVISAAAIMFSVEFVADKVPGFDTLWDSLHTFIRIPAGAVLAVGAIGDVAPAVSLAAAIVGGGLAAGTHATKAGTRVLINTSPEPLTNWVTSLSEDMVVIAGIWAALYYPWLFIFLLAIFILLMIWFLPRILRGIKGVFIVLKNLFSKRDRNLIMPCPQIPSSFTELADKKTKK